MLSDLIDLRGSVILAEALACVDQVTEPTHPLPAAEVRARVSEAVQQVEERLADAFEHAFKPRYRLPTAARAQQVLVQTGVIAAPKGAALKTATRTLWAPYSEFLDTHLKRARFALRDLRVEVAATLPRVSADAARLERLDAALMQGARAGIEGLVQRAVGACEATFAEALKGAVRDLGDRGEASSSAWFAEDGWVPRHLTRCQALMWAIVLHERRHIEALVEAACGGE